MNETLGCPTAEKFLLVIRPLLAYELQQTPSAVQHVMLPTR